MLGSRTYVALTELAPRSIVAARSSPIHQGALLLWPYAHAQPRAIILTERCARVAMLPRRYHSLLLDRGAYFQEIHWDVSWRKHTGSPGFQLWYLVQQTPPRLSGTGNMFMVDSPDDMKPDDHPWKYRAERANVAKLEHFTKRIHASHKSLDRIPNLKMNYLGMKEGAHARMPPPIPLQCPPHTPRRSLPSASTPPLHDTRIGTLGVTNE